MAGKVQSVVESVSTPSAQELLDMIRTTTHLALFFPEPQPKVVALEKVVIRRDRLDTDVG